MNIDNSLIGRRVEIKFTIDDDKDTRTRIVDGELIIVGLICHVKSNKLTIVDPKNDKKFNIVDFSPVDLPILHSRILSAEILSGEFNPSTDARDDDED